MRKADFVSTAVVRMADKAKSVTSQKVFPDGVASISQLKLSSESEKGTYKDDSDVADQVPAGSEPAECIGSGTLSIGNLSFPDALRIPGLNNTLISVVQVCYGGRIEAFIRKEAAILNLTKL